MCLSQATLIALSKSFQLFVHLKEDVKAGQSRSSPSPACASFTFQGQGAVGVILPGVLECLALNLVK